MNRVLGVTNSRIFIGAIREYYLQLFRAGLCSEFQVRGLGFRVWALGCKLCTGLAFGVEFFLRGMSLNPKP